MKKQFFYTIPVVLTWVLGHVFLYVYLNRLLPYTVVNLLTAVLWLGAVVYSHYKWSYFMAGRIYNIFKV